MPYCCIHFCVNSIYSGNKPAKTVKMFRFEQYGGKKTDWVTIINNVKGQYLRKNKNIFFICAEHFAISSFRTLKCCKLSNNAIPTIFPLKPNSIDTLTTNTDQRQFINGDFSQISSENINTTELTTNTDQHQFINGDFSQISSENINTTELTTNTDQHQFINGDFSQISSENINTTELTTNTDQHQFINGDFSQISNENINTTDLVTEFSANIRYPGDIDIYVACRNPNSAFEALQIYENALKAERKKVKLLKQNRIRQQQKIKSLRGVIDELRTNFSVSDNAMSQIKEINDWTSSELMKQLRRGVQGKYKRELRAFALTLNFYSPRAYEYVRSIFSSNLPHPRTIRKWYQSVDAQPGMTRESFCDNCNDCT